MQTSNAGPGSSVPSQRAFCPESVGTFCLRRLVIIIHSLMDIFKRIATLLDPSSVNENTRKLQYNIFVYISSTVGHL